MDVNSADEWLDETDRERRARHNRYGTIVVKKAPKLTSLQEQAKALAEPLQLIEEAYMVFDKNKPKRDQAEDAEQPDRVWDDGPLGQGDQGNEGSLEEEPVGGDRQNNNDNNNNSKDENEQQRQERRRRDQRKREADMAEYEDAMYKISKARQIMDR